MAGGPLALSALESQAAGDLTVRQGTQAPLQPVSSLADPFPDRRATLLVKTADPFRRVRRLDATEIPRGRGDAVTAAIRISTSQRPSPRGGRRPGSRADPA